ncbi:hypothetical protein NMY22_g5921 [Coprinellus aureogranulatus]|nr:hypothetical protein NMY22_g5921 [Coprinellus aureogranulatus]
MSDQPSVDNQPSQRGVVDHIAANFSGATAHNRTDNGGRIDNGQAICDAEAEKYFANMTDSGMKYIELWELIKNHLKAHPQDGGVISGYMLLKVGYTA